jgi:hypothetical protein
MSFHGKMRPEHFDALRAASLGWLSRYPPRYYSARGLGAERHRWDMFHHANACILPPEQCLVTALYKYLDDSHIDTALRYIVRTESSGGTTA